MDQFQLRFIWPFALIVIVTFVMMIGIIGGFIDPKSLMIWEIPIRNPIPDFVMRFWRKIRRYEFTRTLRSTEKRMAYVRKSISYIDQVEGREHK